MNITEKFLQRLLPDFPSDIKIFLKSSWMDDSQCHIASIYPNGKPILFFIPYGSGQGQQTLDPVIEMNRSKIIRKLAEGAGVTTVFLEGFSAGEEMKRTSYNKVIYDLREKALGIKSEEYAQAMSSAEITLVGIDNMTLYRESEHALSELRAEYRAIEKALNIVDEFLMVKSKECSSELGIILETKRAYENEKMTLSEYVKFLYTEAEGTFFSLHDMKLFKQLWDVITEESNIDFDSAERERNILMNELVRDLFEPAQWIGKSLQSLAPEVFHNLNSVDNIEVQARLLTDILQASPEKMQAFCESQFYRTSMYGSQYKLNRLAEADITPDEQKKAFLTGMLYGPVAIATLIEEKQKQYSAGSLSAGDMYHFILDLAIFTGSITRIPNIIRYARYIRKYENLLTSELFRQIEQIEIEIARRASFSDIDGQVLALYLLFYDVRERVNLILTPEKAKGFSEEHPVDNKARFMMKFPVLIETNCDMSGPIEFLDKAESIARKFYKSSVPRGKEMLKNLQNELGQRCLDRAIISIGGFHCKSMLDEFRRNFDDLTSCLVLLPSSGKKPVAENTRSEMAFGGEYEIDVLEHFLSRPPSPGDPGYETFDSLPRKKCGNELHICEAPCIWDRIVCLHSPGAKATFYCATCREYYCGLELEQVYAPIEKVLALSEDNPLKVLINKIGGEPFGLRCIHCGNFVGTGDRTIIWR
ncbi:MAG: hypothetical protein ABRQ38_10130 [Candidatus Eremiobacterota bacterium]